MRVLVTGATGLIGAHTTFELLRAGHQVCLLVRNRDKAERYFRAHHVEVADLVVGDMCDVQAVRKALQGCDALVHAAAVVGVERSRAEEIYRSNLQAIHAVMDTAMEMAIPNIIYVSSIGALSTDRERLLKEVVDESAPLGESREAYRRSKTECERYVRQLQQAGAPIQIVYPTAVLGPDDPGLSESNNGLRIFVSQVIPVSSSGFQLVDARDIAVVHRLLLERGAPANREEGRYLLGGHYYPWPEMADLLDKCSGRKLWRLKMPGSVWIAIGVVFDAVKAVLPFDFPLTRESTTLVSRWVPVSSEKVKRELGLQFRPGEETVTDSIGWLRRAGHL